MKYTNIVVGSDAFITYENKVLVQKRSPTSSVYPNLYGFPGGKVEYSENNLGALIREVREETGIDIANENIYLKVVNTQYNLDIDRLFLGYCFKVELRSFVQPVSSMEGEVSWYDIDKLTELSDFIPAYKRLFNALVSNDKRILFSTWEMKNWEIFNILSENLI